MRNGISMAMAGLGLLGALLTVPAASAQKGGGRMSAPSSAPFFSFCQSEMAFKSYVSRIQNAGPPVTPGDLEKSFQVFLVKKYGLPNTIRVSCAVGMAEGSTQASREARRQQTIDNLRAAKYEVVETDWTYTPAARAPAAASSPVHPQ